MKIRDLLLPSGITEGIPRLVDAHWTSEQALAVVELLDDCGSKSCGTTCCRFTPITRTTACLMAARETPIQRSTANRSDSDEPAPR